MDDVPDWTAGALLLGLSEINCCTGGFSEINCSIGIGQDKYGSGALPD